jgi:hypothetical protein
MAITVNWDDEAKTIIRTTFEGRWTLEEFWQAVQAQYALMDEINYKANFISDFSNSSMLPSGALSHARRLINTKQHPHTGPVSVVVGANRFVEGFFGLFNRVYDDTAQKHRILFAPTLEAGRTLLAERRLNEHS